MTEYVIDCSLVNSAVELHGAIAGVMMLPDWYGGNLDALYDCLTSVTQPVKLILLNFETMGEFRKGFYRVFQDAHEANPLFAAEYL